MLERSRMVKRNPYPLKHVVYSPRAARKVRMTLIAAVKCRDGYIVASDTAVTVGSNVYQGHKIDHYAGTRGEPYRIIIAWSGSMAYAKMASQRIRDEIEQLTDRSFLNMKQKLQEAVREIYITHMGALYWQFPNSPEAPSFSLIVALEAPDGYGIFGTNESAVYEVDQCAFSGSGEELAGFLAERLLVERRTMAVQYSTAAAVHIVKHMFLAAKKSATAVGGNTEIFARLMSEQTSDPFYDELFTVLTDVKTDSMYLWGIDEKLAHGFRMALNKSADAATIKNVMADIEVVMQSIRSAAQRAREHIKGGKSGRLMHLIELDDGTWSANFSEHRSATTSCPTEPEQRP